MGAGKPDVVDEDAGFLHGGKVPAVVDVSPVGDVMLAFDESADSDVMPELNQAGRHTGGPRRITPGCGGITGEARGSGGCG